MLFFDSECPNEPLTHSPEHLDKFDSFPDERTVMGFGHEQASYGAHIRPGSQQQTERLDQPPDTPREATEGMNHSELCLGLAGDAAGRATAAGAPHSMRGGPGGRQRGGGGRGGGLHGAEGGGRFAVDGV